MATIIYLNYASGGLACWIPLTLSAFSPAFPYLFPLLHDHPTNWHQILELGENSINILANDINILQNEEVLNTLRHEGLAGIILEVTVEGRKRKRR